MKWHVGQRYEIDIKNPNPLFVGAAVSLASTIVLLLLLLNW